MGAKGARRSGPRRMHARDDGFYYSISDRICASIVWRSLAGELNKHIFFANDWKLHAGFVLSPVHNKLNCAYASDGLLTPPAGERKPPGAAQLQFLIQMCACMRPIVWLRARPSESASVTTP